MTARRPFVATHIPPAATKNNAIGWNPQLATSAAPAATRPPRRLLNRPQKPIDKHNRHSPSIRA